MGGVCAYMQQGKHALRGFVAEEKSLYLSVIARGSPWLPGEGRVELEVDEWANRGRTSVVQGGMGAKVGLNC